MDAKSSNFVVVKLVMFFNIVEMDNVVSTFQTLVVGSTKCPPHLHLCCSEQISKSTSNKPCMKEHCNFLIHVIKAFIVTWKRVWVWKRTRAWRRSHCLKRKRKINEKKIARREFKWERNELEKMKTLKVKRIRRKTTWRKN